MLEDSGANGQLNDGDAFDSDGDATDIGHASWQDILQIAQRQGYKCALTGVHLEPSTAAVDHIVARADGGGDGKENLHVVHKVVNRMKHTLGVADFIEWCRKVVEHNGVQG